jgi:hypothetical protein
VNLKQPDCSRSPILVSESKIILDLAPCKRPWDRAEPSAVPGDGRPCNHYSEHPHFSIVTDVWVCIYTYTAYTLNIYIYIFIFLYLYIYTHYIYIFIDIQYAVIYRRRCNCNAIAPCFAHFAPLRCTNGWIAGAWAARIWVNGGKWWVDDWYMVTIQWYRPGIWGPIYDWIIGGLWLKWCNLFKGLASPFLKALEKKTECCMDLPIHGIQHMKHFQRWVKKRW